MNSTIPPGQGASKRTDAGTGHFALAAALLALVASAPAWADSASVSPDITVTLDGVDFSDESVAVDNLLGISVPADLGALPESAAVTAYHPLANGDQLFALDTAVELAGAVTAHPSDVLRYDGVGYSVEFDGQAAGIADGAAIDALSRTAGGQLLLSFDTTVDLLGVFAADEDLVQWSGAVFTVVFDGSAQGVAESLDLDGAHDAGGGLLALSFDTSGNVGGVDFDDEDVLLYDPAGPSWTLAYDGSAQHPALAPADVQAVAIALPEPAWLLQLGSGLAFLTAAKRYRGLRC